MPRMRTMREAVDGWANIGRYNLIAASSLHQMATAEARFSNMVAHARQFFSTAFTYKGKNTGTPSPASTIRRIYMVDFFFICWLLHVHTICCSVILTEYI